MSALQAWFTPYPFTSGHCVYCNTCKAGIMLTVRELQNPLAWQVAQGLCIWCFCCATAGLAWASLEVLSYILIRPFFLKLLDGNPKLKGKHKEQARTAIQLLPRVVCFIHNIIQVSAVQPHIAAEVVVSEKVLSQQQIQGHSSRFTHLTACLLPGLC